jgi:hypothetical protein
MDSTVPLDDYEPVASRIQRFYAAYPDGAIHCEIVFDDGQRVVIKATVYRHIDQVIPAAVDFAEEILTQRGVNATSRIENACTSAIGRAISIAAAGLGPSDWTKKPSREEMQKVVRRSESGDGNLATDRQKAMIRALAKGAGQLPPVHIDQMTKTEASEYIDRLKEHEKHADKRPLNADIDEEPF